MVKKGRYLKLYRYIGSGHMSRPEAGRVFSYLTMAK